MNVGGKVSSLAVDRPPGSSSKMGLLPDRRPSGQSNDYRGLTLMLRSEASTLHPGRFAIEILLHPLEIQMAVHKRAVRQRECPVFNVMVRVDDGEHGMAHMPHLVAAGSIHQIELHRLPIR